MLTDEELAELEAALNGWDSLVKAESVINKCKVAEFARYQITCEQTMRLPLTAEICERLGMVDGSLKGEVFIDFSHGEASDLAVFDWCGSNIDINANDQLLTVGHLFAAATLAGVELDWRKVGK